MQIFAGFVSMWSSQVLMGHKSFAGLSFMVFGLVCLLRFDGFFCFFSLL